MTPTEFLTRANQRFADNEFQNITERSFRDAAQDQADTFVAQGPPNIPFYKEGTTYHVNDVVQYTDGPTQLFAALADGKLPVPSTPQGDANWRLTVPIVSEVAFAQALTLDQTRQLAAAGTFKPGRLYILTLRVDNTNAQLADVRIRALSPTQLEPTGWLMQNPLRQVSYELATDTTSPTALPGASGITASQLEAVRTTLAASATQTGSYTLQLADAGQQVPINSSSAVVVSVPTDATAAFAVGTILEVSQEGTGQVTIAGASGVTVTGYGGAYKTSGQYAAVGLRKTAANAWRVTGGVS